MNLNTFFLALLVIAAYTNLYFTIKKIKDINFYLLDLLVNDRQEQMHRI